MRAVTVPVVPAVSPDTVVLADVPSEPNEVYEPSSFLYSHLLMVSLALTDSVAVVAAKSVNDDVENVGFVLSILLYTLVDVTRFVASVTRTVIECVAPVVRETVVLALFALVVDHEE